MTSMYNEKRCTKFVGFTVDLDILWKKHVNEMVKKLSPKIFYLKKL